METDKIYNTEFLSAHFIWDNKNNKPFDVFLEKSQSTRISLGWFNSNYQLTDKGIKNVNILLSNYGS